MYENGRVRQRRRPVLDHIVVGHTDTVRTEVRLLQTASKITDRLSDREIAAMPTGHKPKVNQALSTFLGVVHSNDSFGGTNHRDCNCVLPSTRDGSLTFPTERGDTMSDAQHVHIDDNVSTLVRLCGYSPEHALAELTAFSHREKAGLIPASRALEILAQESDRSEGAAANNRRRWRDILRTPERGAYSLAA